MKRFIPPVIRKRLAVINPRLIVDRTAHFDRMFIATKFIHGDGIEIGALHNPLRVPRSARVKYVDRMPVPELKQQYPTLEREKLVEVDIIDDGETLATVADNSQDFVIASHFIEHCQNPISALQNMLRVLRAGGVLFLAIPNKRYTFDIDRPVTSLEHLWRDYEEGPEWSRRQHFEEWVCLVNKTEGEAEIERSVEQLMERDYSIHYHAWTQHEMLEWIMSASKRLPLNFEFALCVDFREECILVLRKTGTP